MKSKGNPRNRLKRMQRKKYLHEKKRQWKRFIMRASLNHPSYSYVDKKVMKEVMKRLKEVNKKIEVEKDKATA